MSDTPRTDERENASFESVWSSWVEADFARQLERELAEAKKDTERLEWILNKEVFGFVESLEPHEFIYAELHSRADIDAEMEVDNE